MKTSRILVLTTLFLLGGAAAFGYTQTAETAAPAPAEAVRTPAPPAIRVVAAERRELVEQLVVTGSIVPRQEAAVGIDLSGMIVQELLADEGDVVKKGAVLAVLDRSMLDTQLAQAEANRAQAEASIAQVAAQITDAEIGVRQASESLERARELQKKGIAAQSQLDNAVNAYDSAVAKLESARKALAASTAQLGVIDAQKRNVELQIEKTEVRSPADGLILDRNATLGGIVGASGGALFRIAIDGDLELSASVAETSLGRLKAGMPVEVSVAGAAAPTRGQVRMIEPEVNQTSRMGIVRIALDEGEAVRVGNFARGAIETMRRDGVAVPSAALIYRGTDGYLQKVAEGRVSTVPVEIGVRSEGFVEVVDGIAAGDEVVSRAGTFVADGDMVTPVREEDTGAVTR
ncbi:efflux RND transporter periplasmic adaptor subunit [Aquibium sp. ELW1220]|uniref:efflux RND transporter periplasmic adaptor subunit n=1 Tax=Aquibium sp. ELW1220 TaxID=2976766 RepID=UPI0025B10833|nr:efflux RND transporter periplasmic adaptor subunit [Aquibium sp. ELW1220]MDN2582785.1 efflux RND transporter periplasmic adaptor subunit [Aquibium sp. ELW1220]